MPIKLSWQFVMFDLWNIPKYHLMQESLLLEETTLTRQKVVFAYCRTPSARMTRNVHPQEGVPNPKSKVSTHQSFVEIYPVWWHHHRFCFAVTVRQFLKNPKCIWFCPSIWNFVKVGLMCLVWRFGRLCGLWPAEIEEWNVPMNAMVPQIWHMGQKLYV